MKAILCTLYKVRKHIEVKLNKINKHHILITPRYNFFIFPSRSIIFFIRIRFCFICCLLPAFFSVNNFHFSSLTTVNFIHSTFRFSQLFLKNIFRAFCPNWDLIQGQTFHLVGMSLKSLIFDQHSSFSLNTDLLSCQLSLQKISLSAFVWLLPRGIIYIVSLPPVHPIKCR